MSTSTAKACKNKTEQVCITKKKGKSWEQGGYNPINIDQKSGNMTENITTSLDIQNSSFDDQPSSSSNYSGQGAIAPEYQKKLANTKGKQLLEFFTGDIDNFSSKKSYDDPELTGYTGGYARNLDGWQSRAGDAGLMGVKTVDKAAQDVHAGYATARHVTSSVENATNAAQNKAQGVVEDGLNSKVIEPIKDAAYQKLSKPLKKVVDLGKNTKDKFNDYQDIRKSLEDVKKEINNIKE